VGLRPAAGGRGAGHPEADGGAEDEGEEKQEEIHATS
jgi:hypothetical protein